MMVHSPHFNFNSRLPSRTDVSPDYFAVLSNELCHAFVNGASSDEAPAAERSSGSGSGSGSGSSSPSEEKQLSQCGEKPRGQQWSGRSRSGGGRGSKDTAYKGIRKRQGGRWVSEIREPGKKSRIWLGTFPTPEMAARAYDLAAFNLKKPYAYVNFPEAVSSLPTLQSRSPKHIQEAASAAAAAFRGATTISGRTGGVVPTSQVAQTSNLSSTSSPMPEQQQLHSQSTSPQTTVPSFYDKDLIFNMPNVMAEMAEGLMITPPLLHHGTDGENNNCDNDGAESSLWDLCASPNSN